MDSGDVFEICYYGEIIYVWFEVRIVRGELPSELTFAYNALRKISMSSLAYGRASVN